AADPAALHDRRRLARRREMPRQELATCSTADDQVRERFCVRHAVLLSGALPSERDLFEETELDQGVDERVHGLGTSLCDYDDTPGIGVTKFAGPLPNDLHACSGPSQ